MLSPKMAEVLLALHARQRDLGTIREIARCPLKLKRRSSLRSHTSYSSTSLVTRSCSVNEQHAALLSELNQIVQRLPQRIPKSRSREAGCLKSRPAMGWRWSFRTRSGSAGAMRFGDCASPERTSTDLQLRMGIHSGPVNEVVDVNQRPEHCRRWDQHGATGDGLWRCRSHPASPDMWPKIWNNTSRWRPSPA